MNLLFFPQGGRDKLIVVLCHSCSCHSQDKEEGVNLKYVQCHSFYCFFYFFSKVLYSFLFLKNFWKKERRIILRLCCLFQNYHTSSFNIACSISFLFGFFAGNLCFIFLLIVDLSCNFPFPLGFLVIDNGNSLQVFSSLNCQKLPLL